MIRRLAVLVLALGVLAACGKSVSKEESGAKLERSFASPIAQVHAAAKESLKANGFEVSGEEATFLTGHRPNQMGLFVGSGGENIGVWLTEVSAKETKVAVATKLTALGVAGQSNWDDEVMDGIATRVK